LTNFVLGFFSFWENLKGHPISVLVAVRRVLKYVLVAVQPQHGHSQKKKILLILNRFINDFVSAKLNQEQNLQLILTYLPLHWYLPL
jgi:hypothetical protein